MDVLREAVGVEPFVDGELVLRVDLRENRSGSCLLLRCGGSGVQPRLVSLSFFSLEPNVF